MCCSNDKVVLPDFAHRHCVDCVVLIWCLLCCRSQERSACTKACHAAACSMMQSRPGGCCAPAPFLAALLLAEDQVQIEVSKRHMSIHCSIDSTCPVSQSCHLVSSPSQALSSYICGGMADVSLVSGMCCQHWWSRMTFPFCVCHLL